MAIYGINGAALTTAYRTNGTQLSAAYDIGGNYIFPDLAPTPSVNWLDTAIATELPTYSVSGIKQGACTDGTYIYIISFASNAYTNGTFVKYKISDGSISTVAFDGSTDFGHGNDMCYNPNNNHIYVLCMSADGKIVELDTDFNVIAVRQFVDENGDPYYSYRVAFDKKNNTFVTGRASEFLVADQNFGFVRKITLSTPPTSTGQGCETDGDFIYRLQYNPGYILISGMDGASIKNVTCNISQEPEAIMYNWATGKYYVSRYEWGSATGHIYEVQLKA